MQKETFIPVSIVKDWEVNNYKTCKPFNNRQINGSELKENKEITKEDIKLLRYNIRKTKVDIANTSISKPKIWKSRGLDES